MKKVVIYMPHNAVGMSVTLMKELCWVASIYAQESAAEVETQSAPFSPSEVVSLVSHDGNPVQCFSGNSISIDHSLDQIEQADIFMVGAFWGSVHEAFQNNKALLSWLSKFYQQHIPIAATSNAPFFLAEAGLLNDKVATVYPPVAEIFRHLYPSVNLRPERAITDAGNLYCANGIASGCDLIVSMIELLYGPDIARRISHEFLIGFNRSYTLANVSFDGQKYHRDSQVLTAQQWLERNFSHNVSMAAVAADISMSPRNFSRRFKKATGDSPSQYLQRVRIEAAKELLRDTDISVAEVGYQVGFSDLSYFSRIFNRHEGCLPHSYRLSIR